MNDYAQPQPANNYNLLMISGDSSIARNRDSAFMQMLSRFSQHWQRIDILTPSAPDARTAVLFDRVHVHPAPGHRALQPVFIRQKGTALLRERPYHLVTSHDYGFFYNSIGALWLLRGRNIPLVSEILHVEGYPRATNLRERSWRAVAMRYLPWMTRRVAGIRVMNQHEVPDLLRRMGVPDEKIMVLPALYLDFDIYRPLPDSSPKRDILFVGRLSQNKGVFILLEALRQVRDTHPQIRLGLRGEGPLRESIQAYVAEHGLQANVLELPRVTDTRDMARLYNEARMLVCASTVEGGPRVTAEAMACGIPVISTPVGVMPELIRSGENGYLFNWDASELAGQIRHLLDSPAEAARIAEAGRVAVQPFQADAIIARYAGAYHRLIADSMRASP